jgi:hypothetical protein
VSSSHQGDQCIDGEHCLTSSQAVFDDPHLRVHARNVSARGQDVLVDLLLVVDQDELGVSLQQVRKTIAERLRWPDAAVGQFVEHLRIAELAGQGHDQVFGGTAPSRAPW